MANLQLARRQERTLETAPNGLSVRPTEKQAKLAAQLVIKLRVLVNQPALDVDQLKAAGAIWAEELIKAGIPPRRWDEVMTLARQFRPSASKAFAITCDQMIDVWDHHILRGSKWVDGEWVADRDGSQQTRFCGECRRGYRYVSRELKHLNEWGAEVSFDPPHFEEHCVGTCQCQTEYRVRDSYFFRRFAAAWEIARGAEYQPTSADLLSLSELKNCDRAPLKRQHWDGAIPEYFATADNPTLRGFCASEAFEDIQRVIKREAEERRWRQERDTENARKREEEARDREEKARKREEEIRLFQEKQRLEFERKWEDFQRRGKAAGEPEPPESECPF